MSHKRSAITAFHALFKVEKFLQTGNINNEFLTRLVGYNL